MMSKRAVIKNRIKILLLGVLFLSSTNNVWSKQPTMQQEIKQLVDQHFKPVLEQYDVPGMSIAVTLRGQQYFINYGVADRAKSLPVNQHTLFEIGSVSKTFTATLAMYAQALHYLSLQDHPAKYLPTFKNTAINQATLLHLATYSAGGLPLQFPEDVENDAQALQYLQQWQPVSQIATTRQYSNPSIGLFGNLTAAAMQQPFEKGLQHTLFPQLGLKNTFVHVPKQYMSRYAWGYDKQNQPIRVNPGAFDAQAYGIKTSSADLLHFVELQFSEKGINKPKPIQQAIQDTHQGYFKVANMTQALGWELYAQPAKLETLLEGNSTDMIFGNNPVTREQLAVFSRSYVNKTGSTNGFSAYVAFIPAYKLGVVMLANKNFPIDERVKATYQVMQALQRE